MKRFFVFSLSCLGLIILTATNVFASEADLIMPVLSKAQTNLLIWGLVVCALGLFFGVAKYIKIKRLPTHESMAEVSKIIFETCKTYLLQQGKFLFGLLLLIGTIIGFYFGFLQQTGASGVSLILGWTLIGILGSYGVAWFGIRINTLANSRMAFASLLNKPLSLLTIPLGSGMSIGVTLISVELLMMLIILLFMPANYAGACFIGFAIGESLGASVLRICGGIFTKIADIGSDLMKVIFKLPEDDPRNPGVIADCTGDNAGDSVGPTADGFETYGVTGVALISFIVLAVLPGYQAELITWIFAMRIIMVITSILSYWINGLISKIAYGQLKKIDYEKPLTNLVWLTSILSITATFIVSYFLIGHLPHDFWIILSIIISCGTLGAALIPEFTKIFTSTKSRHVQEIVNASREGGASLTVLSGIVSGNFSAFWEGLVFCFLMFVGAIFASMGLSAIMIYPAIFAFALVAFGFLGMGPVTIAVDSYGPVTDNAQSIYELSQIESKIENMSSQKRQAIFHGEPDLTMAKEQLEANDGAGNTFKATAKPVLIGTAVVGATAMIFSLILLITKSLGVEPQTILNILNPYSLMGLVAGGAVIYWFSGASNQAVSTGAFRAVAYIKKHINLEAKKASIENSKEVVKICTQYAQKGMINIFISLFCFALAFAFLSAPVLGNEQVAFFVFYLIGIAIFGLFQAIFMANAGGAWDNAKKLVEVELKEKGTPLHDAVVIGDTVGDPFKDTASVSLNPIIKFTTLFGLLAMEIALSVSFRGIAPYAGVSFLLIALIFVYRSFYKMRTV